VSEQNAAPPSSPTTPSSSSVPGATAGAAKHRTFGMKLTAKQQMAFDLRQGGKTREQAAKEMGISKPVYSKTLQAAYKKLGISSRQNGDVAANAVEFRNPNKFAAIVDAATEPLTKLTEALREAGVAPRKRSSSASGSSITAPSPRSGT
jgi:DNA-binding CsgD family transcriptional regulator